MSDSISIDFPVADDIEAIVRLEYECALSSRGAPAYLADLDDPHELLLVARNLNPASNSKRLVGIFSARLVIDELLIDNLAVASDFRKTGIASMLLEEGLNLALKCGAARAFLEVRTSNIPALSLYRKAGFAQIGTRKSYYNNPDEDALVLSLNMIEIQPL